MGNLISRNSTATQARLTELGCKLEASDAAIVAKELHLAAKLNELERRNNEHSKLLDEADFLRKQIEDLDKDRKDGQQEKEKLEAELQLKNADKRARERALDAMRAQQEKLIKDLGELMERHQSSSLGAAKLAADRDAVERELRDAVEQRMRAIQQFDLQMAELSNELVRVRDLLDLEKTEGPKLRNEIVSIKYSNFETLEATKKLLIEAQDKHKALETEFLRVQKASDERKARAEAEMDTAREAYDLLKKESETRLTALEFDVAEAEMKNVSLGKECAILRSRIDDNAAVATISLVDSEKHDSQAEIGNLQPKADSSDASES